MRMRTGLDSRAHILDRELIIHIILVYRLPEEHGCNFYKDLRTNNPCSFFFGGAVIAAARA